MWGKYVHILFREMLTFCVGSPEKSCRLCLNTDVDFSGTYKGRKHLLISKTIHYCVFNLYVFSCLMAGHHVYTSKSQQTFWSLCLSQKWKLTLRYLIMWEEWIKACFSSIVFQSNHDKQPVHQKLLIIRREEVDFYIEFIPEGF